MEQLQNVKNIETPWVKNAIQETYKKETGLDLANLKNQVQTKTLKEAFTKNVTLDHVEKVLLSAVAEMKLDNNFRSVYDKMSAGLVVSLQIALQSLGYQFPKYGLDGRYTNKGQDPKTSETWNVVRQFQQHWNLSHTQKLVVDGWAGENTLQSLLQAMKEGFTIPSKSSQKEVPHLKKKPQITKKVPETTLPKKKPEVTHETITSQEIPVISPVVVDTISTETPILEPDPIIIENTVIPDTIPVVQPTRVQPANSEPSQTNIPSQPIPSVREEISTDIPKLDGEQQLETIDADIKNDPWKFEEKNLANETFLKKYEGAYGSESVSSLKMKVYQEQLTKATNWDGEKGKKGVYEKIVALQPERFKDQLPKQFPVSREDAESIITYATNKWHTTYDDFFVLDALLQYKEPLTNKDKYQDILQLTNSIISISRITSDIKFVGGHIITETATVAKKPEEFKEYILPIITRVTELNNSITPEQKQYLASKISLMQKNIDTVYNAKELEEKGPNRTNDLYHTYLRKYNILHS